MKGNQLRIGNYVYRQSSKLIVDKSIVYQIENVNLQSALKYEPIPLTEEWLLKMGFVNFGKRWTHSNLSLDIIQGVGFYMQYVRLEINYVHTLQNLYFAITGEELTVNN